LCTLGFGENLFEVLVAALWRFPGWVAEGFVDLVHVEGVEEGGVGLVVRGGGDGRHGGGLVVWLILVVVVFDTSHQLDLVIDWRALSHAIGALIARCAVCRYRSAPQRVVFPR